MKAFALFLLAVAPALMAVIIPFLDFYLFNSQILMESDVKYFAALRTSATAFCFVVTQLWLFVLATNLQELVFPELRQNLTTFKWLLLVATISGLLGIVIDHSPLLPSGRRKMLFLVSVDTLSFVAHVFNFAFISRQIRTIELQKRVSFGDYYDYLFAFLLYWIGLFWIQPRVNMIFSEDNVDETPLHDQA